MSEETYRVLFQKLDDLGEKVNLMLGKMNAQEEIRLIHKETMNDHSQRIDKLEDRVTAIEGSRGAFHWLIPWLVPLLITLPNVVKEIFRGGK